MDHSQSVSAGAILTYSAATVAIAGAALAAVKTIAGIYRRTLGSRRLWVSRLDRLACGVTTEYAEALLGVPVFRHVRGAGGDPQTLCDFRTPHAWVQTVCNSAGAVLQFSVTVTDPKLKLDTSLLGSVRSFV